MFYVYEWYIEDTGEIIYVGKGTKNRYKAKKNNKMLNYLLEHNKCNSRIVKVFDNEDKAFRYEKERIDLLKSQNQCVCNKRKGGFGGLQSYWTEENRKRMSENNPMKSQLQRERMSRQNPMKIKNVALSNGKSKKRAIFINDVKYDGQVDAAKALGLTTNTILRYLRRGYDGEGNPCRYANEPQKDYTFVKKTGLMRAVIVDGIKFDTVTAASKHINVWPESIIRAIKKGKLCKGHECRYDNQQPSQMNSNKNSSLEGSETNG